MRRKRVQEIDAFIGAKLRAKRIERGISQKSLSKSLDVSYQQIQKYEKGFNRISGGSLYHIANVLGVNVSFFYEGVNQGDSYTKNNLSDFYAPLHQDKSEYGTPPIEKSEIDSLVDHYSRISSRKVRKAVLNFIRGMSD